MTLRPDLTVNDLLRDLPGTLAVLAAAGIDTCCGGAATLEQAAARAGLGWHELRTRLETPTADPLPAHGCGCGCGPRRD